MFLKTDSLSLQFYSRAYRTRIMTHLHLPVDLHEERFVACNACHWRHKVLNDHEKDDCSPDSHDRAEFDDPIRSDILRMYHTYPGELWYRVFDSCLFERYDGRLHGKEFAHEPWRDSAGRQWVTFNMRDPSMPSGSSGQSTTLWFPDPITGRKMTTPFVTEPYMPFTCFHQTKLRSLVGPTSQAAYGMQPLGNGILAEGFRYGHGSHDNCRGVNFYSVKPCFNFNDADLDIWVICHLLALDGKKLKGGAEYRYCVRGTPGELCRKVALQAISCQLKDLPPLLFY